MRLFLSPQFKATSDAPLQWVPDTAKTSPRKPQKSVSAIALTIANDDGSGVNDRNQDANPLNDFSLIFRERYAYLEKVIR